MKFIVGATSGRIYEALHAAGVFEDDPNEVRRVIIDLEYGNPAKIYVERYADDSLISVVLRGGVELVVPPVGAGAPNDPVGHEGAVGEPGKARRLRKVEEQK